MRTNTISQQTGAIVGRHHYVILNRAVAGREREFEDWYDHQHLSDLLKIEGVISARRFKIDSLKVTEPDAPQWQSVAIYEIDSDHPQQVLDTIAAVHGTAAMPASDALDRSGMVQILAHEVAG